MQQSIYEKIDELVALVRRLLCRSIMTFCRAFPIDEQKVVFSSFFSTKFNDNPRAIFEAMRDTYPQKKYIWLLRNTSIEVNGAEVVNASSLRALYHLATAKYWIDNSRKRLWVTKRKNQKYIQTWHGGIALKRVEADVSDKLPALYVKAAKHDSQMADLFLSGSRWQTESIKKSYWYNGKILEYGLPRSDIFFSNYDLSAVNTWFNLDPETKVLLYAPTFRADKSTDCYNMEFNAIINSLQAKFDDRWVILLRLHPNIANKADAFLSKGVVNASNYQDINELILRSNIVVTDYSSCMFDAMEAGKIVFLFATDVDKYAKERGFEFSFDELPFDLAKSNSELINHINDFDITKYHKRVETFENLLELYDDGTASYKVANYIFNQL